MVGFYETYSSESFLGFIDTLHLDKLVQLPIAQSVAHGQNEIVQSVTAQNEDAVIVHSPTAQFALPFCRDYIASRLQIKNQSWRMFGGTLWRSGCGGFANRRNGV